MVASGFVATATKWLVVVRLLLGEIPERAELSAPHLAGRLAPYMALTAAVRAGDVPAFGRLAEAHRGTFEADRVQHLVSRLRYNVMRSGLRRISVAYSRISLQARPYDLPAFALRHAHATSCVCQRHQEPGSHSHRRRRGHPLGSPVLLASFNGFH